MPETQEIRAEEYLGLMKYLASSFNKTTGLEYEELQSIAYGAFPGAKSSYNYTRSSFCTHLWNCCRMELINYCSANLRYLKEKKERPSIGEHEDHTDRLLELKESILSLNKEGQEICKMIFESPQEFLVLNRPKLSRGKVKQALREAGWSWAQIWDGFREIKTILSQTD